VTASATSARSAHRPPLWRDVRVIRAGLQVGFVLGVVVLIWWLFGNLTTNLARLGIRRDFAFLDQRAGFTILGSDFSSRSPIREALVVGTTNTLRVAVLGVVIALLLGIVVGVARLSSNWLVRRTASIYVELLRNIPPLVLLLFFYFAVLATLPRLSDAATPLNLIVVSNRGLWVPWLEVGEGPGLGVFLAVLAVGVVMAIAVGRWRTRRFDATGVPHHRLLWGLGTLLVVGAAAYVVVSPPLTVAVPSLDGRSIEGGTEFNPEYFSVLAGLTLYTSAFIAEIVRGSVQAVPRGQVEAAEALGMPWYSRLRQVVLPQAMRIATPAIGNEFLNLSKNVSLGVVVAFPEALRIARVAVGQGQPAPQMLLLVLIIYLGISLVIAAITNVANRRLQIVER
jgi:general L-amino acid transport system permease protein